jgi:DNA (cytosine-5)-methyltransferase 1
VNVLDLFSGIGGFSLGLERAGMRTVAFCEIDPYCRAVLRRHWPDVPVYDDVRTLTAKALADAGIIRCNGRASDAGCEARADTRFEGVDIICGGFPCTDISVAGKGAGITGPQSGLWSEYARIIGEVRPKYVLVENVAALLGRGIERVLGDLAALGFDAEWHCIPASAVGAPHRRDRVWIVAYAQGQRLEGRPGAANDECSSGLRLLFAGQGQLGRGYHWLAEPNVGRVAHGVPARVDRLRALGNAVVPQIPEIIGRAIMSSA